MSSAPGNDDDTIDIRPANAGGVRRRRLLRLALAGGGAVSLGAAGLGADRLLRKDQGPAIGSATESAIDLEEPCGTHLSRLAPDADVVVIDFPSLLTQGLTLDRLAAFVEKANVPHDRLLNDASLAAAIKASGDTEASYYYGHDYQAADIARFFRLADSEGIALNPHELWLRRLMRQLGWMAQGATGAIITLTAAGGPVTMEMRTVILRHEISHGAFYTVPAYRRYTEDFWASLTDADRAAFTGFLGRQGYDTSLTELMLNESQAYLIFTRDPRFFNAAAIGKSEEEVAQLRQGFIDNMPEFWLRALATEPRPPASHTMPGCPVQSAMLTDGRRTCLCYRPV